MAKVKAVGGFAVRPVLFKDKVREEGDNGVNVGVSTGLRLTHYISEVLAANAKHNVSDDVIAAMLESEYPGRRKAGKTIQAVASYRSYYNQGLHGLTPDGQPPKVRSVRYGADGQPQQRAPRGEGKAAAKGKAAKGKPAAKGKGKGK